MFLKWLNKHTDDEVAFFLVEIHAYKIGDSDPAPMFKIIEQPNDFVKTVKAISEKGELNDSHKTRLEFWTMLNNRIDERGKPFNKHKATTDHWYTIAVGSSKCHISIDLVNKEHKMRVSLWIPDDKDLFDYFYTNKEAIEEKVGSELFWDRLDDKKASLIGLNVPGLDFNNKDNFPELVNRAIDEVLNLKKGFTPYLKRNES